MEFVDSWVPRFFTVIDAELDEPTRRRIMAPTVMPASARGSRG